MTTLYVIKMGGKAVSQNGIFVLAVGHAGARLSCSATAIAPSTGLWSVARGRDTFPVSAGENAVIGLGDVHRIANPGTVDLAFIEVQHGAHLDEADIEWLEDDYWRE